MVEELEPGVTWDLRPNPLGLQSRDFPRWFHTYYLIGLKNTRVVGLGRETRFHLRVEDTEFSKVKHFVQGDIAGVSLRWRSSLLISRPGFWFLRGGCLSREGDGLTWHLGWWDWPSESWGGGAAAEGKGMRGADGSWQSQCQGLWGEGAGEVQEKYGQELDWDSARKMNRDSETWKWKGKVASSSWQCVEGKATACGKWLGDFLLVRPALCCHSPPLLSGSVHSLGQKLL